MTCQITCQSSFLTIILLRWFSFKPVIEQMIYVLPHTIAVARTEAWLGIDHMVSG